MRATISGDYFQSIIHWDDASYLRRRGGNMVNLIANREYGSRERLRAQLSITQHCINNLRLSTSLEIRSSHEGFVTTLSLEKQESRYLLSGGQYGEIQLTDLECTESDKHDGRDDGTHNDSNTNTNNSSSSNNDSDALEELRVGDVRLAKRLRLATSSALIGQRPSMLSSLEWYPGDSGMFISGTFDGKLTLWDTNAFEAVYTFDLKSKNQIVRIYDAKCKSGSDTSLIATALDDCTITICDPRTGDSCLRIPGHNETVSQIDWNSLSEHQFVSASFDGTMKIWDVRRAGNAPPLLCFDWHQSHTARARYGTTFTTVDDKNSHSALIQGYMSRKKVRLGVENETHMDSSNTSNSHQLYTIDRYAEQVGRAHDGKIMSCRYTPSGNYIVSVGQDNEVRLWNGHTGVLCTQHYDVDVPHNSIARLPFGIDFAPCGGQGNEVMFFPHGSHGDIAIIPVHSGHGQPIKYLRGHLSMPCSMVYRDVYHQLISAGKDGMIFIWSTEELSSSQHIPTNTEHQQHFLGQTNANEDMWSDDEDVLQIDVGTQGFVPPIMRVMQNMGNGTSISNKR